MKISSAVSLEETPEMTAILKIHTFEPCTMPEAMTAVADGLRVTNSNLNEGTYYRKTQTGEVRLCYAAVYPEHGLLDISVDKNGMTVRGDETWMKQKVPTMDELTNICFSHGCGMKRISAYLLFPAANGTEKLAAGAKVCIWTTSRFGDVGIYEDTSKAVEAAGYSFRVLPEHLTFPVVTDWKTGQKIEVG